MHVYTAIAPRWATSLELVSVEPTEGSVERHELVASNSEDDTLFFLAALSPVDGETGLVDAKLKVLDALHSFGPLAPTFFQDRVFISDTLVIIPQPFDRYQWELEITEGVTPYAVHAMAFHPSSAARSVVTPIGPVKRTLKCGICKSTAKALAVAIAAGLTYSIVPTALLSSVAAFLGASVSTAPSPIAAGGSAAAAAFVASCFGDTVTVIAEKLCLAVGLCP